MNAEVWADHHYSRHVWVVERVGGLSESQLRLDLAVGIGQERPACSEPGAKRRIDLRRVDAHRDHPRVGDLSVFLEREEAAEERLLLGAPPAPVKVQHGGIAAHELGELALIAGVVKQLEVGDLVADGELLTGAYGVGPEAGEWMQQATVAIRACVPLDVLSDTIQPFPTFSEAFHFALAELTSRVPAGAR